MLDMDTRAFKAARLRKMEQHTNPLAFAATLLAESVRGG
jgi:hypothetical protein